MVEVNEDVDKDVVDSLIFTQFLNMEGELEDSYWRPHYSQNSFSSEEIDFDDDVEKSLKCKVGVVNISNSKEKGNLYTLSSTDDDFLEIIPK